MPASMEAKRHSLILGGPADVNLKFSDNFSASFYLKQFHLKLKRFVTN